MEILQLSCLWTGCPVCAGVIMWNTHWLLSTHTPAAPNICRLIWYVSFTSCSELSCSGCYLVLICSHCKYILITTSLHHICHDLWPLLMGNATTCANHFASLIYTASNPQRLVETLNTRLVSPKLGRWALWVDFYANRDNDIKCVAPLAPSLTSSSSVVSSAWQVRVQDKHQLHMDWECDLGRISQENDTKRCNKHTRWVKIKHPGRGSKGWPRWSCYCRPACIWWSEEGFPMIHGEAVCYNTTTEVQLQKYRVADVHRSPFLEENDCCSPPLSGQPLLTGVTSTEMDFVWMLKLQWNILMMQPSYIKS